ncbi:unnamed protein product [Caenorhabditis sp. 36 PRJEB53466]|nr:unnamed protein product [Caenorhabditis sp. 36 PRJEB53466]
MADLRATNKLCDYEYHDPGHSISFVSPEVGVASPPTFSRPKRRATGGSGGSFARRMRGFLLLVVLFCLLLVASVHSHPFFVALTRLQDAEQLMSKRGLDKCGCNLGCFYSSARDCMSCCALAL